MQKKILLLQKFKEEDLNFLKDNLSTYYQIIVPDEYSDTELSTLIHDVEICIGTNIAEKILQSANKLKIIQTPGTGVDNFNLNLIEKYNVTLCNSKSQAKYVAEFAISLLFSLVKKIHIHDKLMREGTWWRPTGTDDDILYLSDSLIDKKIGFIGFGNIGQFIAKFLSGFDLHYNAFDLFPKIKFKDIENRTDFCSLQNVVTNSDYIFITLPLTQYTSGIIDKDIFTMAHTNSLWVHISRGPVIKEDDLFNALINRSIRGIAIDNWFGNAKIEGTKKYPSEKYPFHELNNVLLSPYRGLYINSSSPHLFDVVNNLKLYATSGQLINIINIQNGF